MTRKFIGPDFAPLTARRQTFREIGPPLERVKTRDAALSKTDVQAILEQAAKAMRNAAPRIAPRDATPSGFNPNTIARPTPSTIGEAHAQTHTLEKIIAIMGDVDQRLAALEARKRAALQQQMALQPRSAETQYEQPPRSPTQDRATCACGKSPCECAPQHKGTTTMDMQRHPALAPRTNLTFNPTSRSTRDQQYGEPAPSRFDSREQDRLSRFMPGAGPPTDTEYNASRAPLGQSGVNKRGGMIEAVSSDPSERFVGSGPFDQFRNDVTRPSPAALSELNAQYSKAKLPATRDALEKHWKDYMTGSPSRDAMANARSPWAPRQGAIPPQAPRQQETTDAPWTGLYERNASVIGSDPNSIKPGQQLDLGGGQSHTVQAGETLSGIQSQYGGGSDTPTPPSRPAGLGEGYGQGQEPGAAASRNEEKMLASPTESTSSSPTPTPPTRPSGLGGQGEANADLEASQRASSEASAMNSSGAPADVPTPPSRPFELGGGSQGPSGGSIGNATNPNEGAGESFLKSQGIGTSDARKPRGRK